MAVQALAENVAKQAMQTHIKDMGITQDEEEKTHIRRRR